MKKRLIFNAFSFKDGYSNTPNLNEKNNQKKIDTYLKNIFVSLKSAKINNPNDDVALITNKTLPIFYRELFKKNDILIFKCDFNNFCFPKEYVWSLAFYKLCALKFAVTEKTYEKYLLLDSDTVTVNNYDDLWKEASYGLMLFNVNHHYSHNVRNYMNEVYEKLFSKRENIMQYGGEFIAGNQNDIKKFVEECEKIYFKIKETKFDIKKDVGDELITSIAASRVEKVYDAGAYIDRYWTGRYYLTSTNYKYKQIKIWHLPGEKTQGMLDLYKYLLKNDRLPSKMPDYFGLPNLKRPKYLKYIVKKGIRKVCDIR